jgi:hypothetical protein
MILSFINGVVLERSSNMGAILREQAVIRLPRQKVCMQTHGGLQLAAIRAVSSSG